MKYVIALLFITSAAFTADDVDLIKAENALLKTENARLRAAFKETGGGRAAEDSARTITLLRAQLGEAERKLEDSTKSNRASQFLRGVAENKAEEANRSADQAAYAARLESERANRAEQSARDAKDLAKTAILTNAVKGTAEYVNGYTAGYIDAKNGR